MLSGVPGTGTRDDGYAGALLRVNLDGIVLLRFHALCLKVSLFCVMVALGLLLPLNYTAQCYNFLNVEDATDDVSIDTETTISEECRSNSINNDHNAITALNGIIPIMGRASLDNTTDVEHAVNMLTQKHVDW